MEPLTDREKRILSHTLGLDHADKPYRNYYDPDGDDVAVCESLQTKGFMDSFTRDWLPGPIYRVTLKGHDILLAALHAH